MSRQVRCPKCDYGTWTSWVKGRLLRDACRECGWQGEPYAPERQPIPTERIVLVNQFGGWVYEVFDQYGQPCAYSRSYTSEEECTRAAQDEVVLTSKVPGFGQCKAIIWPALVTVRGKLVEVP